MCSLRSLCVLFLAFGSSATYAEALNAMTFTIVVTTLFAEVRHLLLHY
jgi:hypothetical protein